MGRAPSRSARARAAIVERDGRVWSREVAGARQRTGCSTCSSPRRDGAVRRRRARSVRATCRCRRTSAAATTRPIASATRPSSPASRARSPRRPRACTSRPALLERLARRGSRSRSVTLHVGLGTFRPVTVDDLDEHPMHAERYAVPERDRAARSRARASAARRSSRSAPPWCARSRARPIRDAPGVVRARRGETRLLIQPGYRFRVVDALLTNFHLPRSTLLALVCAFAGRERVLARLPRRGRERLPLLLVRRRDADPRARRAIMTRSRRPASRFERRARRRPRARRRAHDAARRRRDAGVHAGRHAGSVKALTPDEVAATGARIVLGNTYHLWLRPGPERRRARSAACTASRAGRTRCSPTRGGFQAFSLAERRTRRRGRRRLPLAPRRRAQRALARGRDAGAGAARRRHRDAARRVPAGRRAARRGRGARAARRRAGRARCLAAEAPEARRCFGIVQGGTDAELRARARRRSSRRCRSTGSRSAASRVGEPIARMYEVARRGRAARSTRERPRYLMGVGTPARSGARDRRRRRHVRLRAADAQRAQRAGAHAARPRRHQAGALQGRPSPLDPTCACPACRGLQPRVPAPPLPGGRDPRAAPAHPAQPPPLRPPDARGARGHRRGAVRGVRPRVARRARCDRAIE